MSGTFLVIKLIKIDNENKEMVESMTYIVVGIGTTDTARADLRNRMKNTRAAYYKFRKIWS